MWVNKETRETELAEVRELHRSLAQAMNHQFPPGTPEPYVRGWNAALVEVHLAVKTSSPRANRGRSRQSSIVHQSDRDAPTETTAP